MWINRLLECATSRGVSLWHRRGLVAMALLASATLQAAPGDYDLTFAGTGALRVAIGGVGGSVGRVLGRAVALQRGDEKIVIAGTCDPVGQESDFCVARLMSGGTLDTTFKGPSGNALGHFLLPIGSGTDRAGAIAIQPDLKIVIAGSCRNNGKFAFCAVRLNTDGSLDTGFGEAGSGKTIFAIGGVSDAVNALTLQPDGKILLAGSCVNPFDLKSHFCVARLNPNGTLDAGFDGWHGTGNGKFGFPIGPDDNYANAIALQPDGKIVLVGECRNALNTSPDPAINFDFCVARLFPDGTYDGSVASPAGVGRAIFPIGTGDDRAKAVALQADGRIVIAGACQGEFSIDFCVARLNANGSFDLSFDGPSGDGNGRFVRSASSSDDSVSGVAVQPDGKIVVAGSCGGFADFDFCLMRLHSDGQLDTTFDGPGGFGSGFARLPIGSGDDTATAMAIQFDGKIVVVGTCVFPDKRDICVTRITGGPYGAKRFELDIDGDDVVDSDDMLILTRVALGFTGDAVLNDTKKLGTRRAWPWLREYLVREGGMVLP
jgi:uncharacterized delta-60 repeat protein